MLGINKNMKLWNSWTKEKFDRTSLKNKLYVTFNLKIDTYRRKIPEIIHKKFGVTINEYHVHIL